MYDHAPYALVSILKRFGADNAAPAKSNGPTGVYQPLQDLWLTRAGGVRPVGTPQWVGTPSLNPQAQKGIRHEGANRVRRNAAGCFGDGRHAVSDGNLLWVGGAARNRPDGDSTQDAKSAQSGST